MFCITTIKTIQPFFSSVFDGTKTFEIRLNDRNYKVGDIFRLRLWDIQTQQFESYYVDIEITYVLKYFKLGLKDNYVIFSFRKLGQGRVSTSN